MIGKVIEGRYVGASICKLPEKNVLFIIVMLAEAMCWMETGYMTM